MKLLPLLLLFLLLTGCSASEVPKTTEPLPAVEAVVTDPAPTETEKPDPIAEIMAGMSLEERVGQLFLARCDADTAVNDAAAYHLGGYVLFGRDFESQTPDSLRQTLSGYQAAAEIPLLIAVDEEGGTVTRVSRYPAFRDTPFPSPRTAFDAVGLVQALVNEEEKCQLLTSLGINVNLGPVCDISIDPGAFMYQRSLGQDAQTTASYVSGTVILQNAYGIGSVLKHFPGYGDNTDTHTGIAVDSRSLDELECNDLIPFTAGIRAKCGAIMVSHTIVQALDSELPASLSPAVHSYLRENMGFDGVIVTDDLDMDAITEQYGAGEAAVLAVLAGNDLLCSTDYVTQYNAVLDAVQNGRIDMETLNNAVRHVLEWKQSLGLILFPI